MKNYTDLEEELHWPRRRTTLVKKKNYTSLEEELHWSRRTTLA